MRGDQEDFVGRLRLTLPSGWFGDTAPVLGGLLAGLGAGWASLYGLLSAIRVQARLATVSDRFLDLACTDYFGGGLARRAGETDDALRSRLMAAMRRLRGTRQSVIDAALVAGYAATVFEPARPADTGAYNTPGNLAWGVAGGWGSLQMPLESLVTVRSVGAVSDPDAAISDALPAGGVAWTRVTG
jgi:hypothetical protein